MKKFRGMIKDKINNNTIWEKLDVAIIQKDLDGSEMLVEG